MINAHHKLNAKCCLISLTSLTNCPSLEIIMAVYHIVEISFSCYTRPHIHKTAASQVVLLLLYK